MSDKLKSQVDNDKAAELQLQITDNSGGRKTDIKSEDVKQLEGQFSLLWKFSTRGFVMMIFLAFAFSHLMTLTIERSLLQMSSEGFDRNYSRVIQTIQNFSETLDYSESNDTKTVKSSCPPILKEQLSNWLDQTDLAGLRIVCPDFELILCKPDIIEPALRKYEKERKEDTKLSETSRFSLQVEQQFVLPMMSKKFIIKSKDKNEPEKEIQLYIHYTWIEWKLIEFRIISVIASMILMIFLLLAAGGPVKDASKKLILYSKRLEEAVNELEITNIELEQKTRHLIQTSKLASLGELSATVAHEIKNPLATISSGLQLAEFHLEKEKAVKSTEVIKRVACEVDRLHNILSSMLRFARPASNEVISFAMAPLIEKVILLVNKHASDHNVRVSYKSENCTEKLLGDPIQIEQVLLNLLLNSIEAIETNGNIEIILTSTGLKNIIEVIDDGNGIDEKDAESLFKSFSKTTKDGGTGLGLSISKTIIEKHGGSLTLKNNQNKEGATATIILPTINFLKASLSEDCKKSTATDCNTSAHVDFNSPTNTTDKKENSDGI